MDSPAAVVWRCVVMIYYPRFNPEKSLNDRRTRRKRKQVKEKETSGTERLAVDIHGADNYTMRRFAN
jgi:hypothetical protein